MARAHNRLEHIANRVIQREVCDEDRGLAVFRFAQLLFRTAALEFENVVPQDRVRAFEQFARLPRVRRNVDAHADDLRALTRKDCRDAFHLTLVQTAHLHVTAPHERPPPKPTNTMTSPLLIFPVPTASESAIGIDAADVLPYS